MCAEGLEKLIATDFILISFPLLVTSFFAFPSLQSEEVVWLKWLLGAKPFLMYQAQCFYTKGSRSLSFESRKQASASTHASSKFPR